jgi:hypothetical protein
MMAFDGRPFLLPLSSVPVRVNDQEHKNNKPAGQQHDQNRLMVPDFTHKIGDIRRHSSIYSLAGKSQVARGGSISLTAAPGLPDNLLFLP